MKNPEHPLRQKLLKALPSDAYSRLALLYNRLCAPFYERNIRRPLSHVVDCGLPLIYVSQAPRCGGTLMRNLLDGHPELHTFPVELAFEKNGYHWESLEGASGSTYQKLTDKRFVHNVHYGIDRKFPFFFNRSIEQKLFMKAETGTTREVLDAYFTAFFNAWTNYQGLYEEKRYVAAFCPWVSSAKERVDRFFDIYPDGFRVHVIRSPYAWWSSEKSYDQRTKDLKAYLESNWLSSVEDALQRQAEYPERYILVDNEKLLKKPVESMQVLADALGIEFHQTMVMPSLNKKLRQANTSFGEGACGIDPSVADRWKQKLTAAEIEIINASAETKYQKALEICVN